MPAMVPTRCPKHSIFPSVPPWSRASRGSRYIPACKVISRNTGRNSRNELNILSPCFLFPLSHHISFFIVFQAADGRHADERTTRPYHNIATKFSPCSTPLPAFFHHSTCPPGLENSYLPLHNKRFQHTEWVPRPCHRRPRA